MLIVQNIRQRIAAIDQIIHTYELEKEALAALIKIYDTPHYQDFKELETPEHDNTTVTVHAACDLIKRYCKNAVGPGLMIKITAPLLGIPNGNFYRAIDILTQKGYLKKTGTGATYIWMPKETNHVSE